MMKRRCTAIVLAAGTGSRMKSCVAKQYMLLQEKPVLWYSMQTFEQSPLIDNVILVVGKGDIPYCTREIVERYSFSKVKAVIEGGEERYLSVWAALQAVREEMAPGFAEDSMDPFPASEREDYVFIHDGARPFVTEVMLQKVFEGVREFGACVAGMPVKDTIRIVNEESMGIDTPARKTVWLVQTPQVFEQELILNAYQSLMNHLEDIKKAGVEITDDAMVVETMLRRPVKMIPASYQNIKITSPEDLLIAESFLLP